MTHMWHVYTHARMSTSTHDICWWNELSFSLNKKYMLIILLMERVCSHVWEQDQVIRLMALAVYQKDFLSQLISGPKSAIRLAVIVVLQPHPPTHSMCGSQCRRCSSSRCILCLSGWERYCLHPALGLRLAPVRGGTGEKGGFLTLARSHISLSPSPPLSNVLAPVRTQLHFWRVGNLSGGHQSQLWGQGHPCWHYRGEPGMALEWTSGSSREMASEGAKAPAAYMWFWGRFQRPMGSKSLT